MDRDRQTWLLLVLETKSVAHASHCFYIALVNIADFSPDPADMHINGAAAAYLMVAPDAGKERFTRENAVGMSDKILE